MITTSNQIFRITYEAFSKFSNTLNRCRNFDQIADCFTVNLKYLFNSHVFRASYDRNGTYVHLECTSGKTSVIVAREPEYLEYEKILLTDTVPRYWSDLSGLGLPTSYDAKVDEQPELWGWNLANADKKIIVSVLGSNSKKFTAKDINLLKLVADNLETKLLELCLIKELDEKNNLISLINEDQKQIIIDRTSEIAIKNKTLLEISVLNAHNVREPLARILGLVSLLDDQDVTMMTEVFPLIKKSSEDLDAALQNIIGRATKDLVELKA